MPAIVMDGPGTNSTRSPMKAGLVVGAGKATRTTTSSLAMKPRDRPCTAVRLASLRSAFHSDA